MSTRLFVGNLSHSVHEKHLRRLFSIYGAISTAEVHRDPRTGQSQCYGFVEMSDDAEAERAIRLLDNSFFGVVRLQVCKCIPKIPLLKGLPIPYPLYPLISPVRSRRHPLPN